MTRIAHPFPHLDAHGVDARVDGQVQERRVLAEESTESKASLHRHTYHYFLLALLAVLAAIGAVVAVVGPDHFG